MPKGDTLRIAMAHTGVNLLMGHNTATFHSPNRKISFEVRLMIDMYIPIFEAKVERIRQKIRELEFTYPDTRVINQLKSDADKIEETIKSAV